MTMTNNLPFLRQSMHTNAPKLAGTPPPNRWVPMEPRVQFFVQARAVPCSARQTSSTDGHQPGPRLASRFALAQHVSVRTNPFHPPISLPNTGHRPRIRSNSSRGDDSDVRARPRRSQGGQSAPAAGNLLGGSPASLLRNSEVGKRLGEEFDRWSSVDNGLFLLAPYELTSLERRELLGARALALAHAGGGPYDARGQHPARHVPARPNGAAVGEAPRMGGGRISPGLRRAYWDDD
jgi:hypothetical protein